MTMFVRASYNLNVMCSASPGAVNTRFGESPMSPPQTYVRETDLSTNLKELVKDISRQSTALTTTSLAFVYGTLKRGFGNHWLMEEQMRSKHCRLVGTAQTKLHYPLVCGPFQVPFLLNIPGSGEHVRGEVYQVDNHCLALLDELEGTSKGHYVRCPLVLIGMELDPSFVPSIENDLNRFSPQHGHTIMSCINGLGEVHAEAYFAAPHYTPGLYRAPHIKAYTEKESATYTRRIHRPQHRTFVEHVYHWIDEQQNISAVQK